MCGFLPWGNRQTLHDQKSNYLKKVCHNALTHKSDVKNLSLAVDTRSRDMYTLSQKKRPLSLPQHRIFT
jgi:hypothetical protein